MKSTKLLSLIISLICLSSCSELKELQDTSGKITTNVTSWGTVGGFAINSGSIMNMEDTATNSFIDEWNLSNELAGGLPGSLISPDEKLSVITNTDVPAKQ
jgi:hypothetical protein